MSLRRCVVAMVVVGVVVGFSSLSFAKTEGGYLKCSNFERREAAYRAEPDNVDNQSTYGQCLIVVGRDGEGLRIWDAIMRTASSREKIPTAFLYAEYIETNGTFNGLDDRYLTKAAEAYEVVVANINFVNSPEAPNNTLYPHGGNWEYERAFEIELTSRYTIPYLYIVRFGKGVTGHHRELKFSLVNYTGDRDLETYYDYHKNGTTLISLEKASETAKKCTTALKTRKRHFFEETYNNVKEICRIIKTAADQLYPLEEQRLNATDNGHCRRDVLNCEEYQSAYRQMASLFKSMNAELKEVFDRM